MRLTARRSRPPRPTTPLRAVITDVDGTLTDAERRLSLRAGRLLARLEARGIPVVLATGNVLPIALAIQRSLGLHGPVIAENGGLAFFPGGENPRIERLADRRVALAAFRHLRREGVPVRRLFTDRWRETEVGLEPTVPVRVLARHLAGYPVRVEATGFAMHLMSRGAGKLSALARVLEPLGLTISDCLVAGDGDNDVPMLRAAAWALSFPDASARAKRAADYVARRPNADGFVEGVKASGIVNT